MSQGGPSRVVGEQTPVVLPNKERPYAVMKDGILWNAQSVGELPDTMHTPMGELRTLHDLRLAFDHFADRPGVGHRPLVLREEVADENNPNKKFEKLTLGEYEWLTYREWGERIRHFGSGLVKKASLQPKDRVLIYAETQRDWMTSCFAAFNHNLTAVTAYATLGAEAAAYAVNLTKASTVITDAKLLKVLLTVNKSCPCLKHIITMGDVSDAMRKQIEEDGLTLATFEEAVELGKAEPVELVAPTPDDLAIIMFTSGTTGTPKGVRLLHRNIIATSEGARHLLRDIVSENDVYVAYLPLAHIMEIIAEINMIAFGVALGYGSPHTLTDTSVKVARGASGDLSVLRPTLVVFAPLVLEKIYNGINAKVRGASGVGQWLFNLALNSGASNFEAGGVGANFLWNSLVFKKIQQMVGGRLRAVLTGSAPLDGNVHKFVQSCLAAPVRQGYGCTETCAASTVQELCDNRVSSVGPPRVSACIKLVDWEEGGYRTSDKDNADIGVPRGEIVIGGPGVSDGYLVDEENPDAEIAEKNSTDFREEDGIRWFYTGDIGQIDADGCLSIIDRKKDLVKLQQGEYVALSKVEGVLKLSKMVDNALVHVSPHQSYCTALVCPAFPELRKLCEEKGWETDMDKACNNPEVIDAVFQSCREAAKGQLSGFETPAKITLIPESRTWTPENDMLTAAMKLKRKPIIDKHKKEIDAMY